MKPLLDRLNRFTPGTGGWVVSCYLKLEPRDRARGKYLIKLKNRIRERTAWLHAREPDRARRLAVERDLDRLHGFLADPTRLPAGQGIAVFASGSARLFEAVALPHVFRSRLVIDRSPLVRELAALADEYGMVLCAVCDRTSARLFQVSAFGIQEAPGLGSPEATRGGRFRGPRIATGRGPAPTSPGEHNYHRRIREEKHRHYAGVAGRLFEMARATPTRGIVLGGVGVDAGALVPHLHPYLADQLLGTVRLNPKNATPAEVMAAVRQVRRDAERRWEAAHLRQLRETDATGWSVNGVEVTLRALMRGQVRTLLVDPDAVELGFRCGSGRLTTDPNGCRGEGGAEPVPDVIDDAIEDALRQGAHVDSVEDRSQARQIAGLAALLRFRRA